MLLSLVDRVKNSLVRQYRKAVFLDSVRSNYRDVYIVGDYTLINQNVTIGQGVTIYPGVMFFGQGPIVIGDNVNIGKNNVFYASEHGGIYIGNNTMTAADCYIIDSDHGMKSGISMVCQADAIERVEIGSDVWLAAGVKVLKGSKIGDGAVIGANAVVKGSVPQNAVAVGMPAKVIKYRE